MNRYLLLLTLLSSPVAAQELEQIRVRTGNPLTESLDLEVPRPETENPFSLGLEDIDDLTATIAVAEDLEFYASASNLFEIDMVVDRYDEDQLADFTPPAIDDTYPVDVSSRFISAGLRFTF